jgi:hypothetical protein
MNKNPSEITDDYWVYSESETKYPNFTDNSGKWLVFVYLKDLDVVWKKISIATKEGKLGGVSKCATAKPNPNATNNDTKVICVYTYNSEDKNDVARVALELYKLGVIANVINYKKDIITVEGRYANKGDKKISTYSLHISNFKDKTEKEFLDFFNNKYSD